MGPLAFNNPLIFAGQNLALLLGALVHTMEQTPRSDERFACMNDMLNDAHDAKLEPGRYFIRTVNEGRTALEALIAFNDTTKAVDEEPSLGACLIATDMDLYDPMPIKDVDHLIKSIQRSLPADQAS